MSDRRTGQSITKRIAGLLFLGLLAGPATAGEGCIILQYHHVSTTTPPITSVTPAQFEAHLEYLERHHFSVLPLEEVVHALAERSPLPDRCVTLTFDDAYASLYREVLPRLRARSWPATVFVPTDGVDQGPGSYLSWARMREMARQGFTFANHSASHAHLIRRRAGESESDWSARVTADLRRAQYRLKEELGEAPPFFVYPYGEYDEALLALVASLGYTGLGQQSGAAGPWSDPRVLPRYPLSGRYAEPKAFAVRAMSQPLPVRKAKPEEPVLGPGEARPRLRLELAPGGYRRGALACYAGSERLEVNWESETTFSVQSRRDLPVGRSRYNCTAPDTSGQRYFWFSHLWIRRRPDGQWYRE